MRRVALGLVIVVHGLAHASVGVWATADRPFWLTLPLWGAAMVGYLAAGFGILRMPLLRHHWKWVMVVATTASIVLCLLQPGRLFIAGGLFDVGLLLLALEWGEPVIDEAIAAADRVGTRGLPHPVAHRLAWGACAAFLLYAIVVVVMRPVFLQWGTTAEERTIPLPGDRAGLHASYRLDHAITIRAPADSVWPWLVQLGQDRGGFYSYAWLERLVGDDIRNADRINPAWQRIAPGDLVRATQPTYLGGIFGDLGWRVSDVVPGRAIVLENWGSFVVRPIDSATSRLIIRTRGEGRPTLLGVVLGPLGVFVLEPAHFIMQRGMMRGIRDRAEGM
jgi:hypothetical protein